MQPSTLWSWWWSEVPLPQVMVQPPRKFAPKERPNCRSAWRLSWSSGQSPLPGWLAPLALVSWFGLLPTTMPQPAPPLHSQVF
jgi:hypothetical protein